MNYRISRNRATLPPFQKINFTIIYLFKIFRKLLITKGRYFMKCENDKIGFF